jgi:hypothetical protein
VCGQGDGQQRFPGNAPCLVKARGNGLRVGRDDQGAAASIIEDRGHDGGLGFGIEVGGRLIKEDEAGIAQEQPGEGNALGLTARKADAIFADNGRKTFGERGSELSDASFFRRLFDLGP